MPIIMPVRGGSKRFDIIDDNCVVFNSESHGKFYTDQLRTVRSVRVENPEVM
jgi:hypothetical protein